MDEWKVSSNIIGDKKIYGVYRLLNKNEVDHSGNRETVSYYDTREEAKKVADKLNRV